MQYVVGSVPYVNAKPLVAYFEHLRDTSPVKVLYQVPSQLPALLDNGSVQAILVSSFDSLRTPGRRIAAGCVSTYGPAQSVRLFSKVPIFEIRTLALDASSLTSNHLAQVILRERYETAPTVVHLQPELGFMLAECDACVIIGDKGMLADGTGLQVLDLGEEWTKLTDLPFVYAAWIGGEGLTEDLAACLERAKDWALKHLDAVVEVTQRECRWPGDSCRIYLKEIMNYDLTDRHVEGLRFFQQLLLKHGFLERDFFPTVLRPSKQLCETGSARP